MRLLQVLLIVFPIFLVLNIWQVLAQAPPQYYQPAASQNAARAAQSGAKMVPRWASLIHGKYCMGSRYGRYSLYIYIYVFIYSFIYIHMYLYVYIPGPALIIDPMGMKDPF